MNKLDKYTYYIALVDILFMPLFPLVSVSMSLPILVIWYVLRGRRTHFLPEYKFFTIAVGIMAVSTLLSPIFPGDVIWETSFATSIKRFLQYLTSYWYFFFFAYIFNKYDKKIASWVILSLCFIALIAVYYLARPEEFVLYKSIINPADPHTRRYLDQELGSVYRYTFWWSDANNVAYAAGGMMFFCLAYIKNSVWVKYLTVVVTFFILLCTMSMGGVAVVSFLLIVSFFATDYFKFKKGSVGAIIVVFLIGAFFLVKYSSDISQFIDQGILLRSESYSGASNSGGRWDDFLSGLGRLSPVNVLIGSGLEGYVTEVGHIYMIGLYGFPVYVFFLFCMFRKRKYIHVDEYFALLPFFMGFTMNIAIGDQKYLLILCLINAFFAAQSIRRRELRIQKLKNNEN